MPVVSAMQSARRRVSSGVYQARSKYNTHMTFNRADTADDIFEGETFEAFRSWIGNILCGGAGAPSLPGALLSPPPLRGGKVRGYDLGETEKKICPTESASSTIIHRV